jgi:hypothetical protein
MLFSAICAPSRFHTAKTMAGKAMPGSVAMTHDVWTRIKDRFEGESLGELEIKGKGTIPVAAVRRKRPRR